MSANLDLSLATALAGNRGHHNSPEKPNRHDAAYTLGNRGNSSSVADPRFPAEAGTRKANVLRWPSMGRAPVGEMAVEPHGSPPPVLASWEASAARNSWQGSSTQALRRRGAWGAAPREWPAAGRGG